MKRVLALFVALVSAGFILDHWRMLMVGLVVVAVLAAGKRLYHAWCAKRAAERRREKVLLHRAEAQNFDYLRGFEYGLYGRYRPARLD